MVAENPTSPEEQAAAQETEPEMDILTFLREQCPKSDEEFTAKEVNLIEPLRKELRLYEDILRETIAGISEEKVQKLSQLYAHKLEITLQDNRPYVDLCNRAFASGRLSEEITRAIAEPVVNQKRDLTLDDLDRVVRIDLDLDEFKTFNDLYGHNVGDEVLGDFSDTLLEGEAVTWLKGKNVLAERAGDEPSSLIFTSEGGEEFGGMIVFREGLDTKKRQAVMEQFAHLLQNEVAEKIIKAMEGKQRVQEPKNVDLPEDFKMESGISFGYASVRDVAGVVEREEGEGFYALINKIKARMFKMSDERSIQNKDDRREARFQAEKGSDYRLTAEISPRGSVELMRRELEIARYEMAIKDTQIKVQGLHIAELEKLLGLDEKKANPKELIEQLRRHHDELFESLKAEFVERIKLLKKSRPK